jgi:hypothetical protein
MIKAFAPFCSAMTPPACSKISAAPFPNRSLVPGDRSGRCDFAANAVASLIEQPAAPIAIPTSLEGGDLEQMVGSALRLTKPGMMAPAAQRPVCKMAKPPFRRTAAS